VSQCIRFCDGAVDIRDDHLVVVVPEKQLCRTNSLALITRRNGERQGVRALFQVQRFLSYGDNAAGQESIPQLNTCSTQLFLTVTPTYAQHDYA
jgi:hypothetical protein